MSFLLIQKDTQLSVLTKLNDTGTGVPLRQPGFLLSEMRPEKGPNGHGLVKYFNYDARGHAGRRVDTPNDLTFRYDRAERLVRVRETWGQQRVLKSFVFAESNGTDDSLATPSRACSGTGAQPSSCL